MSTIFDTELNAARSLTTDDLQAVSGGGSRSPSVLTALVVCPGLPQPVDRAVIRRWANSLLRN